MKRKIQPPFLKNGDEVAIISPSFCVDEGVILEAAKILEGWGLRVRIGRNAFNQHGPFAGRDSERLGDLQGMTDDKNIKAVFFSRGGYGLSRIIDKVDFSALKKSPKWFQGFSDITVLHLWLSEVCGIMSIHGEMPLNFNNSEKTPETMISLKEALFGSLTNIEWRGSFFKAGFAEGEMTGGNLSLLSSLRATIAEPVTRGKILFLEDVGEYFYHIDRMMISLRLSGKLKDLSALILGGFNKMEDTKFPWGKTIEETVLDIVEEYDYPVLFNFPAGHIADNRAFYIGRKAGIEINDDKAVLSFL
jgi:muramoyltetrapeptide carboxypeptidase